MTPAENALRRIVLKYARGHRVISGPRGAKKTERIECPLCGVQTNPHRDGYKAQAHASDCGEHVVRALLKLRDGAIRDAVAAERERSDKACDE